MTNLIIASSSGFVDYEGFNVNVTSRVMDLSPSSDFIHITALTLKVWVYAARHIAKGLRTCEKSESAEIMADSTFAYPEPPCTVWGDVLPRHGLTVHSHTNPQDAIATWWTRYDALESLGIVGNEAAQPPVTTGNNDSSQNVSGGELPGGVIIGKMNPSSTKVYYQNGQTVALPINRIKLTFIDGYIYEMWGTNGNGKYPALKIYKTKKGKDENSDSYIAVKDTLEALKLSLEGTSEAHGKWWLIGDINHVEKDGTVKEYFNVAGIREQ